MTATVTAGRYATEITTGEHVFVTQEAPEFTAIRMVRRMDGTLTLIDPGKLAPVTDDENMAAAVEWGTRTGQLIVIDDSTDLDALLG